MFRWLSRAYYNGKKAINLPYHISNVDANQHKFIDIDPNKLNNYTLLGIDNLYYCTAIKAVIRNNIGNNTIGILHFEPIKGKQEYINKFIEKIKYYKQKGYLVDLTIIRNQDCAEDDFTYDLSRLGFDKVKDTLYREELYPETRFIDQPDFIIDREGKI